MDAVEEVRFRKRVDMCWVHAEAFVISLRFCGVSRTSKFLQVMITSISSGGHFLGKSAPIMVGRKHHDKPRQI